MKVCQYVTKLCRCRGEGVDENSSISKNISTLESDNFLSRICSCVGSSVADIENRVETETVSNVEKIAERVRIDPIDRQTSQDEADQGSAVVPTKNVDVENLIVRSSTPAPAFPLLPTKDHPLHPEHEREVLNVYSKILTLNKKRNRFLILTISVIVISSVILAAFEGCFLANIIVYPDGPCPAYGLMNCFHSSNFTYFQCTPGDTIDFPLYASSATCFRWIGRDTSISDVMTQIGVSTGLLTAFGSVVQVLLRLLIFVFQQRRGVSAGMLRMMEKTVGINRITQPSRFCGYKLPFHFGVLNLRLYQHPSLVILFFMIYVSLPLLVVASIVLLSYFRISITSLTYIILLTFAVICCLGLLWMLWEEDEMGRIMPGAWMIIKDIISRKQLGEAMGLVKSIIPGSDVTDQESADKDETEKLTSPIESIAIKRETQQLTRVTQVVSRKIPVAKKLTGSANEIRSKQEVEKSKDISYIDSRKN